MRRLLCVTVSFVLIIFVSCGQDDRDTEYLQVTSWNVQNIFNAVEDGYEYEEYLPSSGWTETAYQSRLNNLARVCLMPDLSKTDVFIFNEIENSSVVEDIMNLQFFRKNNFVYYAVAGESKGAIKTAVISRIPIVNVKIHNITDVRPVLQVELQNEGEHIYILAVHAKSNLEGVSETSGYRLSLAKTLAKISSSLEKTYPGSLILMAGDFNESYENRNMMSDARNGNTKTPLLLLPDFKPGYYYCPWLDDSSQLSAQGSYMYKNEWKCYDNILVSYGGGDGCGWEYKGGGVVFQGILQTTDNKPNSFRRDLLTGVSDHLPVWVRFSR